MAIIILNSIGTQSFSTLLGSNYYNVSNDTNGVNKVNGWPLNFMRTGGYTYSGGYLSNRITVGNWWSNVSFSTTKGRRLGVGSSGVDSQNDAERGYGFALRCLVHYRHHYYMDSRKLYADYYRNEMGDA